MSDANTLFTARQLAVMAGRSAYAVHWKLRAAGVRPAAVLPTRGRYGTHLYDAGTAAWLRAWADGLTGAKPGPKTGPKTGPETGADARTDCEVPAEPTCVVAGVEVPAYFGPLLAGWRERLATRLAARPPRRAK